MDVNGDDDVDGMVDDVDVIVDVGEEVDVVVASGANNASDVDDNVPLYIYSTISNNVVCEHGL